MSLSLYGDDKFDDFADNHNGVDGEAGVVMDGHKARIGS